MLNDAGIRGATVEWRGQRDGYWINGVPAGHSARTVRRAIRMNPERFTKGKRVPRSQKVWVLRRVK